MKLNLDEETVIKFEEVKFFTYLGTVIAKRAGSKNEIKARMAAGTRSTFAIKPILSNKIFSRARMLRL